MPVARSEKSHRGRRPLDKKYLRNLGPNRIDWRFYRGVHHGTAMCSNLVRLERVKLPTLNLLSKF